MFQVAYWERELGTNRVIDRLDGRLFKEPTDAISVVKELKAKEEVLNAFVVSCRNVYY